VVPTPIAYETSHFPDCAGHGHRRRRAARGGGCSRASRV